MIVFNCSLGTGGGSSSSTDPNTILLINSNGTDGSIVFQDTSMYGNIITRNGDTHHETDQPLAGFGSTSIHFDGTTDTLQVPDSDASWAFGVGDFTIDIRVRLAAHAVGIIGNGYNVANQWQLRQNP